MVGGGIARLLSAVMFAGVTINWVHFSSDVYPFTISQPSSFKHVVLTDTAHIRVDYFSPSLGSAVTDVSVFAVPGSQVPNPRAYLRAGGGRHVHTAGKIKISGRQRTLTAANFNSFGNHWIVEQVSFAQGGLVWRLSASYEPRYATMRPVMVRMLQSFVFRTGAHH
jgi:hypothetical protein